MRELPSPENPREARTTIGIVAGDRGDLDGPRSRDPAEPIVHVWDPLVRIAHWALAVAVSLGWATTTAALGFWHVAVGEAAVALVAVRVVWGFVGPRYARFAQFVRSPRATWTYVRLAATGRAPRPSRPQPLGACMVLAFFACIAGLAATGTGIRQRENLIAAMLHGKKREGGAGDVI